MLGSLLGDGVASGRGMRSRRARDGGARGSPGDRGWAMPISCSARGDKVGAQVDGAVIREGGKIPRTTCRGIATGPPRAATIVRQEASRERKRGDRTRRGQDPRASEVPGSRGGAHVGPPATSGVDGLVRSTSMAALMVAGLGVWRGSPGRACTWCHASDRGVPCARPEQRSVPISTPPTDHAGSRRLRAFVITPARDQSGHALADSRPSGRRVPVAARSRNDRPPAREPSPSAGWRRPRRSRRRARR